MKIKTNLLSCKGYFTGLLIILVSATLLLLLAGKAASFIIVNNYHPFLLNVFFINYTFIGDGIFAISLIALCFVYKRNKPGLALLLSFLLSGLIVQVIKNLVYAPRPRAFFEDGQYLFFIDRISRTGYSSFPSGHTATAFAIATVFVLLLKNKKWQLPVLLAAVLVGYSRIYLAQHFLIDVIMGSIIGCISGIVAIYLMAVIKKLATAYKKLQSKKTNSNEQIPTPIQAA